MDENVMRVLQMLQDGKISSQEAETLIAALRGETNTSAESKAKDAEPEKHADKPFMEEFKAKFKAQKIDLDFEHLGEKISRAVSNVHPEKIVARVQTQLRNATKSSASWGAAMSARVRNWADGADALPVNSGNLPEQMETHEQEYYLEPGAAVLVENPLGSVTVTGVESGPAKMVIHKTIWGATDALKAVSDSLVVNVFATDSRLDIKATSPDHFHDGFVNIELILPKSVQPRVSTRFGAVSITAIDAKIEAVTTAGKLSLSQLGGDVRAETASGAIDATDIGGTATVATESGDIVVDNIRKGVSANSASGDVTARNIEGGRVECKSVSGDVWVENIGALAPLDVVAESLSGGVKLTGAAGNIALKAVSGNISADQLVANRVQAQTVSGDVMVKIHTAFSGTVQISTVSGDVELGLPTDTNARVSLSTTSGDLRCDHDAQSVVAANTLWTGQIGTGAGNVTVQTISGDSHIGQVS